MRGIIEGRRSYVAGEWVEGEGTFPVENPADESRVADAGRTSLVQIIRAVTEGRRAFDQAVWAGRPATERARVLESFLDHVEASRDELVTTMMAEALSVRLI